MTVPSGGFVHLHNHSEYSLLDGMARITKMVERAAELGMPALADTDHGSLAASWKFAHACRENNIKPILGLEIYMAVGDDRFNPLDMEIPDDSDIDGGDSVAGSGMKRKSYEHLTLLVRTAEGWRNLVQINNAAANTIHYKPVADTKLLAEHAEGLMCLTGCLGGPVAGPLSRDDVDTARKNLARLVEVFGHENVYVEMMDHGIDAEVRTLAGLRDLANEFDLPVVVTNDCHYVHEDDEYAHTVWTAMQSKRSISDPRAFKFNGAGYHLRSSEEMRALRKGPTWTAGCDETLRIADRVDEWVLPEVTLRLPHFPLPDGFDTEQEYLHHLVLQGAKKRFGKLTDEVKARLRHEENVIAGMGMSGYMLIVADYVGWAKSDRGLPTAEFPDGEPGKKKPILVGPGRGSGAGSLFGYVLGITDIEPLRYDLLFERFLEPGRVGMPDFDVDFEMDRADEVVEYLRHRYGFDNVARIGTFGMARTKAAIKSVASRTDVPEIGNALAKLIPVEGGKPAAFAKLDDPKNSATQVFRDGVARTDGAEAVLDVARRIENTVTGAGIHPCGVIISDEPLTALVPMRREPMPAKYTGRREDLGWVTEWDGKDCEAFGLLKADVLRLRNLDVASLAAELVNERHDLDIDPAHLPDPDTPEPGLDTARNAAAFAMLRDARTTGIFQIDSSGMTELVGRVQPQNLSDLSAVGALYRPGPMAAGSHLAYAARKNGHEPTTVANWTTDPDEAALVMEVFADTFGLMVYQEQVMRLAGVVAGFNASERSKLRKAMGKKEKDVMDSMRDGFVARAQQELYVESEDLHSPVFQKSTAEALWTTIEANASYLFNKCLTGDTKVLTGKPTEWTLEDLYKRLHGTHDVPEGTCRHCGQAPGVNGPRDICGSCRSWLGMVRGPRGLRLLAQDPATGRIQPQLLADVHYQGPQEVYELRTASGRTIKATANHRFLTVDGYRQVDEMIPGATTVITHEGYEVHEYVPREYRTTTGRYLRRRGHKPWLQGEMNSGYVDGGFVALKTWTAETIETAVCECGATHADGRMERAHLDGDRTNNHPSNLRWMCVSCHKRYDYAMNKRNGRWGKGHAAGTDVVVSITYVGVEDTYDVEMADGTDHNFVANGIISHNSHSAAYGQITYITAFLKANWPAEFAAATLANTTVVEKRQSMLASLAAEGITAVAPDINTGQVATSVVDDHTIQLGLGEIKEAGDAAESIVAERNRGGDFKSLYDLLARCDLNSKVTIALIEAGALDSVSDGQGRLSMIMSVLSGEPVPGLVAEWDALTRSARQRNRLGVHVGEHPLVTYAEQLDDWRPKVLVAGAELDLGGRKPTPLADVLAMQSEDNNEPVTTIGLLSEWSVRTYRGGQLAGFRLEAADGTSMEGVVWNDVLQELLATDQEPRVGSIVAVFGKLKVVTREVEREDEAGNVLTESQTTIQLTAHRFLNVDVDDEPVVELAPAKPLGLRDLIARSVKIMNPPAPDTPLPPPPIDPGPGGGSPEPKSPSADAPVPARASVTQLPVKQPSRVAASGERPQVAVVPAGYRTGAISNIDGLLDRTEVGQAMETTVQSWPFKPDIKKMLVYELIHDGLVADIPFVMRVLDGQHRPKVVVVMAAQTVIRSYEMDPDVIIAGLGMVDWESADKITSDLPCQQMPNVEFAVARSDHSLFDPVALFDGSLSGGRRLRAVPDPAPMFA